MKLVFVVTAPPDIWNFDAYYQQMLISEWKLLICRNLEEVIFSRDLNFDQCLSNFSFQKYTCFFASSIHLHDCGVPKGLKRHNSGEMLVSVGPYLEWKFFDSKTLGLFSEIIIFLTECYHFKYLVVRHHFRCLLGLVSLCTRLRASTNSSFLFAFQMKMIQKYFPSGNFL